MQPIKFTRTDDEGKPRTRFAHTAAEAVKLRFDGWTEEAQAEARTPARASTKSGPTSASATDRAPTAPAAT